MGTLQNNPTTIRQINQFLWEWLTSRQFLYLVQGFLAIAGCVVMGYLVLEKIRTPFSSLEDRYLAIGTKAFEKEDYEKAALCFRRVLSYDQNSHRAKYHLAIIAHEAKDEKRAIQIMVDLVNQTNEMTAPAAYWLVQKRLKQSEDLSIDDRISILKLLERIVKTNPKHLEARLLLVKLFTEKQQWDEAITHMKKVTEGHPEFFLNLSRLYLASGSKERAVDAAKLAAVQCRKNLLKSPSHLPFRISTAESLLIQQEFDKAKAILKEGFQIVPTNEIKSYLSRVFVLESQTKKLDIPNRIALLKQAIFWNQQNAIAYDELGKIISTSEEEGQAALEILEKALAEGIVDSSLIHTILGTAMLSQEKAKDAIEHLEQANASNPNTPLILNNLALALAKAEKPNLDKALKLVDIALKTDPNHVLIRETRGQIVILRQEWDEALKEFEFVLPFFRTQSQLQSELPRIHKSLALIYEKLGNERLSKQHEELAKETVESKP